ncbi:PLP-dependent aminotransferase family protein [Pseudomonas sp. LB-090624]|uniref:aminotransferase-like domain-containing protein n=1 Tax=Pseudomonas sp. LB-090624 TaxID=2213079 RepID=UPI000D9EFE4D|nr:PLP-dependent aminotransferase family protein [Pseudomonas sp. LB-090624]PYB78935.1 PLP-dependent aminotransferase family protein [Pseudomonas sp. LB-090624]
MWVPHLSEHNQPVYLAIVDALGKDIARGQLRRGDRLPTLRELATALDITPGTVSRAYTEASRRGLTHGEVGRGTYVLGEGAPEAELPVAIPGSGQSGVLRSGVLDLSIIKPQSTFQEPWLRSAFAELSQGDDLGPALDYVPDGGHPLHRQAAAAWLSQWIPDAEWQQVVLTSGAQHGLMVAISALTRHQDLVLCESLCYPGIISVVHGTGRRLAGVPMDEYGIIPQALRDICKRERPAMLVCVATCQNPTTAIMPNARRAEIAAIAREFDFLILDDDIYGFLATDDDIRPLSTFAPERSIYLTSLSKSVLPALRIGYLYSPARLLPRLTAMVRSTVWMPSPLTAHIASHVLNTGLHAEIIARHRAEAAARQAIARDVFQRWELIGQPFSYHAWLKLPAPWGSDEFATLARANGVLVMSANQFEAGGSDDVSAVRIVLMSPTNQSELRFALTKLVSLLETNDPKLFY